MRKLLLLAASLIGFCAFGSGQSPHHSGCPTIEVEGPKRAWIANDGTNISFTAKVSNDPRPVDYQWFVSWGTISSGQGTPVITVSTQDKYRSTNEAITATVEIKGFSPGCRNYASETSSPVPTGDPLHLDEYSKLSFEKEKAHLIKLGGYLTQNPRSSVYILKRYKRRPAAAIVAAYEKRVLSYLRSKMGIPSSRVKIVVSPNPPMRAPESTQFTIVQTTLIIPSDGSLLEWQRMP